MALAVTVATPFEFERAEAAALAVVAFEPGEGLSQALNPATRRIADTIRDKANLILEIGAGISGGVWRILGENQNPKIARDSMKNGGTAAGWPGG